MVELVNEQELLKTNVEFSIEKKNPYTEINSDAYYKKCIKDFNYLIKNRLDEIGTSMNNADKIKEGFRLIMEAKYHNHMSVGTQIILSANMEKMFEDYLKWIVSFNPDDNFYDTLVGAITIYINSTSNDKIEDYFNLPKEQEINKEEKEAKMENVIVLPSSKDEQLLNQLHDIEKLYPENKELADAVLDLEKSIKENQEMNINKDHKEENLNKEQIINFFKGFNPFVEIMNFIEDKFTNFKGIKFWQTQAIAGNVMILMNDINSSLYKAIDNLMNYIFEGEGLRTKKDLVFDSMQAVPQEDLSINDFFIGIQSQLTKLEYIKIFGNIINHYQEIKETFLKDLPIILHEVLDRVLPEDKQVDIYNSIVNFINGDGLSKEKICKMIISDVQKSSDTPEDDLKELQVVTEGKEAALNMIPNPIPVDMKIAYQQPIIPSFAVIGEPSDLNDYEEDGGFVVGGDIPRIIEVEELKDVKTEEPKEIKTEMKEVKTEESKTVPDKKEPTKQLKNNK